MGLSQGLGKGRERDRRWRAQDSDRLSTKLMRHAAPRHPCRLGPGPAVLVPTPALGSRGPIPKAWRGPGPSSEDAKHRNATQAGEGARSSLRAET